MKRTALILMIALPLYVQAGGFQLNLQGQKQTGMGHTGTGLLSDASAVLFNPGGLSLLDSSLNINGGFNLLFPRVRYLAPYPGNYRAETVHNIGTPFHFYVASKIEGSKRFSFGFGIYTPFGSKQQWEDNWIGQFLIREIDLKTICFQPTFSVKITDELGIGAGFVLATGSFGLRKGIPAQDSTGAPGEAVLNGRASGFGYNAGIFYKGKSGFSAGFDFRSSVLAKIIDGSAEFSVPSSLGSHFPSTTFNTSIRLPFTATLGLGYTAEQHRFALDVNYVGWSSYDSLVIDFAENTEKLTDSRSPRNYKNSFIFRLGYENRFNERFTFRAGAYFDMTPVQDGYLTPETPDVNKLGLTCGASIRLKKGFSLDFSILYIEGMKRTDTNLETQFGGTYKSRAFIPGTSLSFVF
jgi:long-chain fatty acid transport protein